MSCWLAEPPELEGEGEDDLDKESVPTLPAVAFMVSVTDCLVAVIVEFELGPKDGGPPLNLGMGTLIPLKPGKGTSISPGEAARRALLLLLFLREVIGAIGEYSWKGERARELREQVESP